MDAKSTTGCRWTGRMVLHARDLLRLEEALADMAFLQQRNVGADRQLPRLHRERAIPLSRIRSRLIEAFDAPAAWRRAVKARTSAVVIVSSRRCPKKGVRCFFNRSSTTRRDRRRFVW